MFCFHCGEWCDSEDIVFCPYCGESTLFVEEDLDIIFEEEDENVDTNSNC